MIRVQVECYGGARDLTGWRTRDLTLDEGSTAADLLAALAASHPALKGWVAFLRLAVNQEYADPGTVLRDGDAVAVIPPVSGG
jgi:molybdopterin converting factor subunit 1